MPVPNFEQFMLPMLTLLGDGAVRSMESVRQALAAQFRLSESDLAELLPSGGQPTFTNRVGWARTHMKKAGLVDDPRRNHVAITPAGKSVLAEAPPRIDNDYLLRFPTFVEFRRGTGRANGNAQPRAIGAVAVVEPPVDQLTPEESLQRAYENISTMVESDLLSHVKQCSPAFFERLVVELLVRMGYGGTEKDAAQAVGRTGDGGIDGVIREDALGLDFVYIQAKRWESSVGSPQIQQFVGALTGKGASKGVFITTSNFTSQARQYASTTLTLRLVLVDGEQLAALMLRYDVGVSASQTYVVKKLDSDYFSEE